MELRTPTFDMIVEMHDVVLQISGGKEGFHAENDVRRAAERPLTFVHYAEHYDINTLCALLVSSIARYHGFSDGNKRTALMVAIFTYRINGVHFKSTITMNKEFDALVMWVVKKKPEIEDIENRLVKLRDKYEIPSAHPVANLVTAFMRMRARKEAKKSRS
jgi:death-on-curing family protein